MDLSHLFLTFSDATEEEDEDEEEACKKLCSGVNLISIPYLTHCNTTHRLSTTIARWLDVMKAAAEQQCARAAL